MKPWLHLIKSSAFQDACLSHTTSQLKPVLPQIIVSQPLSQGTQKKKEKVSRHKTKQKKSWNNDSCLTFLPNWPTLYLILAFLFENQANILPKSHATFSLSYAWRQVHTRVDCAFCHWIKRAFNGSVFHCLWLAPIDDQKNLAIPWCTFQATLGGIGSFPLAAN